MDKTYYKFVEDKVIQSNQEKLPEKWDKKFDWIGFRTDDRKEVSDYFRTLNRYNNTVYEFIERPEEFPFSNAFEKTIVLNLSISNAAEIYQTDYISVIIDEKLITVITPNASEYFNERRLSTYSEKKYPSVSNYIFYVLTATIIAQSNVNISVARKRIQGIELSLANSPDKLTSMDLMACERDVSQLSDIIEDQYLGFQLLDSFSPSSISQGEIQKTSKLIKGFEPLDKAILRLEKKAESLRIQYMLIQQEKSTRKINVLTIIQAVFVPMTFIAGVYGMNFKIIPELEWDLGYLLVWIVFVGMACGLLIYFYRKGWFK